MLGYDNLATIRSQVQRIVYNTSTSSTDQLNDAINAEYQTVAASQQWPQLLRTDKSGLRNPSDSTLKTLEAADEFAPLPFTSARLMSLHHQTTVVGRTELEAMDPQRFYEMVGNKGTQTGVPQAYCYVGRTAQIRRAAAGSATAYCSVSGNDTSGAEVTIRFRESTAVQLDQTNKVTLTGAFSAGISLGVSLAEGYSVEDVILPAGWVGSFRIVDSAANDIVSWKHYEEPSTTTTEDVAHLARQLIEVWPIPQSDYGLTIHWYRDPMPLVADEDTPEIPVAQYLVDVLCAELLENAQRPDAPRFRARAEASLRALRGLHKQDAPRIARPYGGNLLRGTGVEF